jgi:TP901 family phage tail tape measure protein
MAQSFNASLNVSINPASLNASTKQVSQALGRITGQASEFQKSLDASTARVFAFGATTAVLNGVTQSFKKLVSTTIEVQKRLIEINSIFQASESAFNRFRNSIFQVAKETGQAFNTVAEGAAELARQGLSAEETAKRLKAALVLTRISGLDAEKSVKSLTAAINGFASAGLSANQIVNKMVAVDTAFAVSAQDLADGFSRAGSTAEDAGVSFNELLALITAVEQRTARGGAVIGNAFKSIFTRLQRGTTIGKLQELGVAINATQTGVQKLQALSSALERISDPTVTSQIKELAGGVFQINVVSAALKDLSSETGVFAAATKVAATATNEAFEKNKALSESMAHNINVLVVGLTSLAEKVGAITFGPLLESLVGLATKFTNFLDKALDPEKGNSLIKGFFKGIGAFLSGPMVILFTAAFVKITKLVAKFAIEGMRSLFAMGTQAERLKQIQGGIVGLLGKDVALRSVMENSASTLAQKEQAVIAAIQRENALLTQQAQLMRTLAAAAAARGVSGFNTTTGVFAGGRRGRFNAGFRAEEAEARMRGAPAGVRGRHSAGTIGGKKFIMNTHETEIPRFGRNGDSAVIPHYAGGFVPNYARRLPSVADIEKGSYSQFFDGKGNARSKWMTDAMADPNSARGAALLARKKKAQSKRSYYANEGRQKTVMVIPKVTGYDKNLADHKFLKPHKSAQGQGLINFFEGGIVGISSKLEGNERFGKLVGMERTIEDNLTDAVNNTLSTLHVKTDMSTDPHRYSRKNVKKIMEKGGAGALGAIKGSVFEALIQAITGGVAQDKGQLDIDFSKDEGNILDLIFGISGFSFGDFKSGDSRGNKTKFAKQTIDNVKGKVGVTRSRIKRKNDLNRAAGFIPNFAGGGVPSSRIRVHRDSAGEPLAVTNTRDEPRGLQDAIGREKKGIGMFSSGFVPNYAFVPPVVGQRRKAALSSNTPNVVESGKKLSNTFDKMQTSGMGLFMIMGSLQSIIGFGISVNEKRIATQQTLAEKEIEKIKASDQDYFAKQRLIKQQEDIVKAMKNQPPMYARLAKAAQAAATALFAVAGLNMATGGALGRSKAGQAVGGFFAGKGGQRGGQRALASLGQGASRTDMLKQGKRARLGRQITRGGGAAALAFGGFDIWNTLTNEELSKHEKSKGVGGAVGGMAGAIGGAKAGAGIGAFFAPATAGLSIPIGALLGGIGGGLLGASVGEGIGGRMSPEARRLNIAENTAQSSFYAAGDPDERGISEEHRRQQELMAGKGLDFTDYHKLPTEISAPILKKMGADIQANMGNVPFDELEAIVAESAASIERWSAERDKQQEMLDKMGNIDPETTRWSAQQIELRKAPIEKAEKVLLAQSDRLANARALQAGWNFKAHADQVAWEGRMQAAQNLYERATFEAAQATFDFAEAQRKRMAGAKQQLQAASDEQMLVNALATGPSAITAKTMAQFNTQDANLEVFRQDKETKELALSKSVLTAFKNIEGGDTGWGTDELLEEEKSFKILEITAPLAAAAEEAGAKFKSEAKKAAVNLLAAETKIAQARIDNQTQIDNLLDQTIQGLTGQVKGMFAGGPTEQFDAGFMESQGKMLAEMAKSAASGQPDEDELMRFGRAVQEYEDMGTGLTPQDMASLFGTTIEEFERAMRNVREASLGGLAEQTTMEGKTTLDLMDKRGGIDDGTQMKKLQDEQAGLIGAMNVVTQKWKEFAEDPNTSDIAKKVKEMEQAINEGSKDADDIKAHLESVLTASESQAAFIEEQTKFAAAALGSMAALAAKMTGMEAKISALTAEGDVEPISAFVGPPAPN